MHLDEALYITSNLVFSYHLINGDLHKAAVIPAASVLYMALGNLCESERLRSIGKYMLLGNMTSAPGAVIGYSLRSFLTVFPLPTFTCNVINAHISLLSAKILRNVLSDRSTLQFRVVPL